MEIVFLRYNNPKVAAAYEDSEYKMPHLLQSFALHPVHDID